MLGGLFGRVNVAGDHGLFLRVNALFDQRTFRAQHVPARLGFARQRRGLHARFDAVGKVEYGQCVGLDIDAKRITGVKGGVHLYERRVDELEGLIDQMRA